MSQPPPASVNREAAAASTESDAAAVAGNDNVVDHEDLIAASSRELPFLVTNWLANYQTTTTTTVASDGNDNMQEENEAQTRIRNAAAELASAFASIGAFGKKASPRLEADEEGSSSMKTDESRPMAGAHSTFADVQRQWGATCPPSQLESIVQASATEIRTMEGVVRQTSAASVPLAARERLLESVKRPEHGRTLQDAINIETTSNKLSTSNAPAVLSTLHIPVVVQKNGVKSALSSGETEARTVQLISSPSEMASKASSLMRNFLSLRDGCRRQESQFRQLQRSQELQNTWKRGLIERRSALLMETTMDAENQTRLMDEIKNEEQNCHRVSAQLQRQIQGVERKMSTDTSELKRLEAEVSVAHRALQHCAHNFRDPLRADHALLQPGLVHRNLSLSRLGYQPFAQRLAMKAQTTASASTKKSIIRHRLTHAATINTHLAYPVYCLRFDRTGRYFVTGADDYLVKLFCLSSDVTVGIGSHGGKPILDRASYRRGAIHVCTLRGHAGVINDIAISSDNAFLATASEDGDVRVWGLKDGSPIAILRGHKGGANMVSWSVLTPYRLVSTAADGLARSWDIREACLKRYGVFIDERPEYSSKEKDSSSEDFEDPSVSETAAPLPPLPEQNSNATAVDSVPSVPLPPLPPALANNQQQAQVADQETEPGDFVANSTLDEGVKLLSKLQHGATLSERSDGVGTRGRRAAVKVICVARCPFGGHFATGSDDGICRVWRDENNSRVEAIDRKHDKTMGLTTTGCRGSNQLLLSLKGHLSAITDLQYSHSGDRILTASQRDGVVRIWSWGFDPALVGAPSQRAVSRDHRTDGGVTTSHILIKLSNPAKVAKAATQGGRRRPASTTANVSCDVAQWLHDDSMIVTSQCELVKVSGTDAVPGSQYIFLWDSVTGHCLLGIAGAHEMQCSVVIPHPSDCSILCTAGADGIVKLWDWETGKCFFSHDNIVNSGPIDPNDRGKHSGYLDGAFSPDGCTLVLTDDSGRVSVFDCKISQSEKDDAPGWMLEQYFANDYYELLYDAVGYCIERGSEKPPHLAPRSVRCTHSGVPWSYSVTEAFVRLAGPFPDSVFHARRHRQAVRVTAERRRPIIYGRRANKVCEYSPRGTTLLGCESPQVSFVSEGSPSHPQGPPRANAPPTSSSTRLSSNWRWGDAFTEGRDDAPENEGDEQDSGDEDFELTVNERTRTANNTLQSDSDEESDSDGRYFIEDSPQRQRRALREIEDSEDDERVEYRSTNNTPSGPYVADYDRHMWNYGNSRADMLNKSWVLRTESASSYTGRKRYTPQVGDSIVYIPRAHYETISAIPQLEAPWMEWPEQSVWPLVRCTIKNVRYRLPYKRGFLPQSTNVIPRRGIVAILTLEVTGIPQLASDRELSWPSPVFIEPTGSHRFELSMFEADTVDFIVPVGLYQARLRDLERTLATDENPAVEAFYSNEAGETDSEYIAYPGRIDNIVPSDDEGTTHLCGSGYRSVAVSWDSSGEDDDNRVSPWEVRTVIDDTETPVRPSLTEEEKATIHDALAHVRTLESVTTLFAEPVDQGRYYDYGARVEVPMDLSFITTRLNSDYYASRHSAVCDVRQIYDNAVKYNGEHDEISALAEQLFKEFEKRVLTPEEIKERSDIEKEMLSRVPPRTVSTISHDETPLEAEENHAGSLRRSGRARRPPRRPDGPSPRPTRQSASRRRPSRRGSNALSDRMRGEDTVLGQPLAALNSRGRADRRARSHSVADTRVTRSSATSIPPNPFNPRVTSPVGTASNRRSGRDLGSISGQERSVTGPSSRSERGLHSTTGQENGTGNNRRSERGHGQSSRHERTMTGANRRSERGRSVAASSYVDQASDVDMQDESEDAGDDDEFEMNAGATVESDEELAVTSESEPAVFAPSRSRRSRRTTTALADSSESEEEASPTRTTRIRVSQRIESSSSEEDIKPSARQRAKSRKRRITPDDPESEEASEEPSSDSEDLVPERSHRTSRRNSNGMGPKPSITSAKRSGRSRARAAAPSYAEKNESDIDEDHGAKPKASASTKRKRLQSKADDPGRAKRARDYSDAESLSPDSTHVKTWPKIALEDITKVAKEMMKRVRQLDHGGFFSVPVIEAAPEVKKEYLLVITSPMDFRTIQEDRIPIYREIRELQQDLLLIFENCFLFNGRDNEYAQVASLIMENLNDMFRSTCTDLDVKISRRW